MAIAAVRLGEDPRDIEAGVSSKNALEREIKRRNRFSRTTRNIPDDRRRVAPRAAGARYWIDLVSCARCREYVIDFEVKTATDRLRDLLGLTLLAGTPYLKLIYLLSIAQ